MSDFASFLESWKIFYAALAGGTAALMGLIFLAVSLRLDMFTRSGLHEPREVAWQTFINFFWVFVYSLCFLIPQSSSLVFGLILISLSVAGTVLVVKRWMRAHKKLTLARNLVAFLPLLVCYLSLIASGIRGIWEYHALVAVEPALILLIGIAVYDAWELLFAYQKRVESD